MEYRDNVAGNARKTAIQNCSNQLNQNIVLFPGAGSGTQEN